MRAPAGAVTQPRRGSIVGIAPAESRGRRLDLRLAERIGCHQRNGSAASDETVLAAIRYWVALLAADEVEAAIEFLCPKGGNRMAATAPHLRTWIGRYEPGAPLQARPARVSPAETAAGPMQPVEEVFRADDGTLLSVDYALPINGEWSELVAFFDAVPVPGGLALALRDMYVA